ncbi:MAG: small, acid-soluble spore protein, alpha/beta type [Lachnospiraceae bacterium]|nr:small, acid-soluble spore protein, alpha/beta type [Lachnospiraceae bacterium]
MEKNKKKQIKLHSITPEEQLKFEIAEELGLLDKVRESGWKSLSAKESGKIGGIMASRKKEMNRKSLEK